MEQKTPPINFLLFPIFHRSLNNNETTQRTTRCLPLGKKQSLCCWDIFLAEISCILQDTIWLSQMLPSSGLPARHLSQSSAWHPTHIWEILLISEIRNGYWILRLFSSQSATPVWQSIGSAPKIFHHQKKEFIATNTTDITLFVVRVPVLSLQIVVADPIVSHAARWRTCPSDKVSLFHFIK
jgi:hypothetical protein